MDLHFTMIVSNKSVFIARKINEDSSELMAQYDPKATKKVTLDEVVDWLISQSSGDTKT